MAALEHNEQKLKLLRSKSDKLNSIAEAVRTLEQTDALIELADDIAALETKVEKQRKKASVTQAEADEAEQQATAAFTSFVEQFNIYFTASSGLWWWHEYGEWHSAKADAFREKFRGYLGSADGYKLFQAILDEQGRKLNQAFYGWEDRPGYLNLLSMGSFCQPVEANSYHPIFDLLFCSLGGGKPENIGHLEKLILAKWQHPENYLLPCAVFADGGGTGKSVLVARFLVAVFGFKNVADNLSMEMAFGKFNKRIAGKAVVFANEAPEDKEDDEGILRVVHSPAVNIEAKGRDPIKSVNTALYFIATNPKSGGYAIRLAYSDVDRRFSIMHGTKPLKWYVAQHYGLPHDDDDDAGWEKMTSELQYVLSDPIEVGRWLHCKQNEYGDIPHLKALHGEDYKKQAADTIEMHTRVFDAIFGNSEFTYIRSDVLFRLYQANGGSFKSIGFHRLAKAYLEQEQNKRLDISYEEKWPWHDANNSKRTQARVYIKGAESYVSGTVMASASNDSQYGREDFGKWTFHVDVI